MTYMITARARNGDERVVHFEPNTLEACAGAMDAMTCGNRRHCMNYLQGRGFGRPTSYTASNSAGDMFTARYVFDSQHDAVRDAQQRGAWPMPRPFRL